MAEIIARDDNELTIQVTIKLNLPSLVPVASDLGSKIRLVDH